jgi:hypothetical protein
MTCSVLNLRLTESILLNVAYVNLELLLLIFHFSCPLNKLINIVLLLFSRKNFAFPYIVAIVFWRYLIRIILVTVF